MKITMYAIYLFVLFTASSSAEPSVCYDYTIRQSGKDIADIATDRSLKTYSAGYIYIDLLIKNQEKRSSLYNSTIKVYLNPSKNIRPIKEYYVPSGSKSYLSAVKAVGYSFSNHIVALGDRPLQSGGLLRADTPYYTRSTHRLYSSSYRGKFEIEISARYESEDIVLSTVNGSLPRCEQTLEYESKYGQFNVERHNSRGVSTAKYPLYTQVVGKDFDFDVVAYTNPPFYSKELSLRNYTVEVELIDAQKYSTLGCENPDPDIIQKLTSSGQKSLFAKFNGRSRVDMSRINIQTDTALRSAAFRIWSIVDKKDKIIPYSCSSVSDNRCFSRVYNDYLRSDDISGKCKNCSSYISPLLGTRGCYACLRDNFSKATCSRDNFAIRPVSYRINIGDSNEKSIDMTRRIKPLGANDSADDKPISRQLAAGYKYMLTGIATTYFDSNKEAKGYSTTFDSSNKYKSSILYFDDESDFYDKNNTKWNVDFHDGVMNGNLVSHNNVGIYRYNLLDSNWTIVDQKRYEKKRYRSEDCTPGSAYVTTGSRYKSGCNIETNLTVDGAVYNDLYLKFRPYSFDLTDVNLDAKPNSKYLFMSNLDEDYYKGTASLSNPMSMVYLGNIAAMSKDGNITTNFTSKADASTLIIEMKYTSDPSEKKLKDDHDISFQRYLSYGSDVDIKTSFNYRKNGSGRLYLPKYAFEDKKAQGTARIRIYTTLKKPLKDELLPKGIEGIDPINVKFFDITARGNYVASYAHMTRHTPKGRHSYDVNATFLYSKVSPTQKLYTVKGVSSVVTPLNILTFCSKGIGGCSKFDLSKASGFTHESSSWYYSNKLFTNSNVMGSSDLKIDKYSGSKILIELTNPAIKANKYIDDAFYDRDGREQNIEAVLVGTPRAKSKVVYNSSSWLEYYMRGQYYYVEFLKAPADPMWSGTGKTGHVVGGTLNTDASHRVEW